jgi:Protein of unknown function (DUF2934)
MAGSDMEFHNPRLTDPSSGSGDPAMTAMPPRPTHNFFPLRFAAPLPVSAAERHAMIETAAYLRAEQRNFEAGHDAEDWLAAEAEVDSRAAQAQKYTGNNSW